VPVLARAPWPWVSLAVFIETHEDPTSAHPTEHGAFEGIRGPVRTLMAFEPRRQEQLAETLESGWNNRRKPAGGGREIIQ